MKNIFVLAMDELQKAELESVCASESRRFHNVMDVASLVDARDIRFHELLAQVRSIISGAGVSVDAIVAQWDFPTSILVPILCEEFGLPSPSLESVLKCEHKYWSRLEQAVAVPEMVPRFCAFDPFSEETLSQIDLEFPFWVKPVKAFSSQLGFLVHDENEFYQALAQLREGIGRIGSAFEEVLEHVELPEAVHQAGAEACLAEELITGRQIAPEGYVLNGKVVIHGMLDMHKIAGGTGLDRLEYPSSAPEFVQRTLHRKCEQLLTHIGFDNGCFNIEFMWDEAENRLKIIEVNTRISQSHSEMFLQVDGRSNHEVAVSVALGEHPHMPSGEGPYNVAAKFILTHPEDGVVRSVPDEADIRALKKQFPYVQLKLDVDKGDRLHDLVNQDGYRYTLGEVYLGADSHDQLLARYEACRAAIPIEISPVSEGHAAMGKETGARDENSRHVSLSGHGDGERLHPDA